MSRSFQVRVEALKQENQRIRSEKERLFVILAVPLKRVPEGVTITENEIVSVNKGVLRSFIESNGDLKLVYKEKRAP